MDKINIKVALSVFNKVTSNGEARGDSFWLDGIYATALSDGYTVRLSDEKVELHIYFHNKFNIEYGSRKNLDEFMIKMDRIESNN
jgi:hypothetical protein